MLLQIPKDMFDNPYVPQLFLCTANKEIIGELPAYDISGTFKWNAYSEITFSVDRMYVDFFTGEHKAHPLFDKVEGMRKVYLKGFGYFCIQDPDVEYGEGETKTVTCFSSEYETGTKYLENFYINTGEEDSKEVIYHASQLGNDYYKQDELFKLAPSTFNSSLRYYVREYTDTNSYEYTKIAIANEEEFKSKYSTLYVQKFENVRFYYRDRPELSLLHLIFKKIPEWSIGNVDSSLEKLERKFTEERIAVYDFLMNEVSDTFKCVIEWDTITNTVNFYEEAEDGITDDEEVQTRYETDVFISRENLANEISIKYSVDNIKTKLKVSGDDSLNIREVNLGQNDIINLDYYASPEWMGSELYTRYEQYLRHLEDQEIPYQTALDDRNEAIRQYEEIMHEIVVDDDILLVGDEFTKLHCVYTTTNALSTWLDIYHVKSDTNATKSDNILFTLRNANMDSITLRVYYNENEEVYQIQKRLTDNSTTNTSVYSISDWVNGKLTAEYLKAEDYNITSIGTLGAYLCLAKDETKEENLRDYSIVMLKEKEEVYSKINEVQIEGGLNDLKYKVDIITETKPFDEYPVTENVGKILCYIGNHEYTINGQTVTSNITFWKPQKSGNTYFWTLIMNEMLSANMENYIRYKQNYDKLNAVRVVLAEKEVEAEGYLQKAEEAEKKMVDIATESSIETFFGEELMRALSPFIREDEFNDSNFTLTGYESEEERREIALELKKVASKELKTLSQPGLEFSMTMGNILALPEFAPIKNQFALGNFVRVGIRPNYVKRARLLEVDLSFGDLSDFNCNFGNLITTKSEIDKHAELLKQAVTAGKQVAASAGSWQKGADKASSLDKAIANGLQNATLEIGKSNNQSITWNEYGIWGRKRKEGTTDQYEDEQFRLTNNKLLFSADGFQTAKSCFGQYTVDGNVYWGVLSDAVIAGYIEGTAIKGGSLEIGGAGGKFVVNEDGSVEIKSGENEDVYASKVTVDTISEARKYHTELTYSGSTVFSEPNSSCTITCKVYNWDGDITDQVVAAGGTFSWIRSSSSNDTDWNNNHTNRTSNIITITNSDIEKNAQFSCKVQFDDTTIIS